MPETADARSRLQRRVHERKAWMQAFLARTQPRSNRLIVASIVCVGLAGLLTAGPAAGGPSFTQAVTQALGSTSPSWRLLCAAATIFSFLATTTLAIHKAQDLPDRVARAQAACGRLESLEVLLETTDIPTEKAADEYARVVQNVSFVTGSA